jgi:hypothetical protein
MRVSLHKGGKMKEFKPIEISELRELISPISDNDYELSIERLKEEGLLVQDDDGDFFISINY